MFALLLLALPQSAVADAPGPFDLGPLLEEVRTARDVPALAGAVVTGDGLIALGAAGVRERGSSAAVGVDDRFHLGSCTKSMTATVLAGLVEEGLLSWGQTLAQSFPEWAEGMDPAWRGVNLLQLLSHTAGAPTGLVDHFPLGLALSSKTKPTHELRLTLVEKLTAKPPASPPGMEYRYSNEGYLLAAAMMERATGSTWEELMRARLFEPLGMDSAGFGPPCSPDALDHPRAHLAQGTPAPGHDNPPVYGPAGTVHATMADWAAYIRLHLRGARGEEGLLLTPGSFRTLHTPTPATGGAYALGWAVARRGWSQGPLLTHDGSNLAWFSWTWIAAEEDFAVLVACNQGGPAGQQAADAAAGALIEHALRARSDAAAPETPSPAAGEGDVRR